MTTSMASVDTKDIQQIATGFLMRAEQVRAVIAKTMIDSPFAASAAMIAGQFAIEGAMTEIDKAFIRRCVERKKILVEGTSGKVPDEAIYAVVAEAAAKQLLLGANHYSVWANGTLYIKEAGYRHLLKIRGDVSEIDISPGLPEWRVLQNKTMWVIPGKASAKVAGKLVAVECTIGINGNATDIIANIEAKAFRSLAKRLWLKISSIELEDGDADDTLPMDQPQDKPAAITQKPIDPTSDDAQFRANLIRNQHSTIRKMIVGNEAQLRFYDDSLKELEDAKTLEQFQMVRQAMNENRAGLKLSKDVAKHLADFVVLRESELKGGAA